MADGTKEYRDLMSKEPGKDYAEELAQLQALFSRKSLWRWDAAAARERLDRLNYAVQTMASQGAVCLEAATIALQQALETNARLKQQLAEAQQSGSVEARVSA